MLFTSRDGRDTSLSSPSLRSILPDFSFHSFYLIRSLSFSSFPHALSTFQPVLDTFPYLYKRQCPSVGPFCLSSVHPSISASLAFFNSTCCVMGLRMARVSPPFTSLLYLITPLNFPPLRPSLLLASVIFNLIK